MTNYCLLSPSPPIHTDLLSDNQHLRDVSHERDVDFGALSARGGGGAAEELAQSPAVRTRQFVERLGQAIWTNDVLLDNLPRIIYVDGVEVYQAADT